MATKKSKDNSFAALVARLNAMSNMTKEEERASLMEAANQEPRILDEKEVSLADIAKLAGIKEYQDETKVSPKAEKLVESITKEPAKESIITKAIAEADADDSISTAIRKDVTEEDKRLSKIAELEQQLADLKAEEKEEATLDSEKFKETLISEITEYVKDAEADKLAELYNSFSTNEVEVKEDSFLIKTPETQEIIADAEKAEAPEEEVVQEKEPEAEEPAIEEQPTEEEVGEDDIEIPEEEIEYTDELTEAKKKPVPTSPDKWSRAKAKARSKFDVYPSAYANAYAAKEYKKMGGGWRMGKPKKKK